MTNNHGLLNVPTDQLRIELEVLMEKPHTAENDKWIEWYTEELKRRNAWHHKSVGGLRTRPGGR